MGLHRIVLMGCVLALVSPFWAGAQCEQGGGTPVQQGCGSYTYEGCCDGQGLYWCEQGYVCFLSCAPDNLSCGWRNQANFYACDTNGNTAPGNNPPIQCPAMDGDGDGYTEDQGDCNDTNQWINPGAAENCVNGVDDDCDGAIDTDDLDCPQGDDDDHMGDDDTGSTGDDDTGSAGDDDQQGDDDFGGQTDDDDDTNPAGGRDQPQLNENPHLGIICGCRVAERIPASPLAALTLLLVVLVVRKR